MQIAHGPFSLVAAPAQGGRVARFGHADLGALLVPMEDAPFDAFAWPKAGAFPLIPFHGRIETARFDWHGTRHQITPHPGPDGHALHGPAQRLPWRAERLSAGALRMDLEVDAGADWPFAFAASQKITLNDNGLRIDMTMTNRAETTAPAGLGWHPYFPKSTLEHDAQSHWPMRTRTLFPSGRYSKTVPQVTGKTTFLSDWSSVTLHNATIRLRLTSDLAHLVLHDDPPTHTCVEPASEPANALNLEGADTFNPGETLTARIDLILM